jgi:hypothetical protein
MSQSKIDTITMTAESNNTLPAATLAAIARFLTTATALPDENTLLPGVPQRRCYSICHCLIHATSGTIPMIVYIAHDLGLLPLMVTPVLKALASSTDNISRARENPIT